MEKVSEEKDKYLDLNLITRKWRVKFYRLNDIGQWDDYGIGYVFCASKINEENDEESSENDAQAEIDITIINNKEKIKVKFNQNKINKLNND